MTSDDVGSAAPSGAAPHPGAGRPRRVLGRGPGALPTTAPTWTDAERDPTSGPATPAPADPPAVTAAVVADPPTAVVADQPGAADQRPEAPVDQSGTADQHPEPPADQPPEAPRASQEAEAAEQDASPHPVAPGAADAAAVDTAADATAADATVPSDHPEPAADEGVFTVKLVNFEGPFDLLLQLISKHKLDVTEVALSRVTDEFIAHIRAMGPDWDLDQTTEFLVVAATLLDLKAARLLPAAEVEDEADLALLEARDLLFARLLQYRAYKQIADIFSGRLDAEARRHPRTVGLEPHHAELLPEVVIRIGAEGFAKLAVKAMQPKPEPQVYVDHIHAPLVSVVEQAEVVVARLRKEGAASFRSLVADAADTLTVVARFLALLELYREKAVALDQEDPLGELIVRWTGGGQETGPMVTDEFDRAPEPAKDAARDAGEEAEDRA